MAFRHEVGRDELREARRMPVVGSPRGHELTENRPWQRKISEAEARTVILAVHLPCASDDRSSMVMPVAEGYQDVEVDLRHAKGRRIAGEVA